MALRKSALLLPVIAVAVLAADIASKQLALKHLHKGVLQPVAAPFFGLTLVTNTGTAFGMWQSQQLLVAILPPLICMALVVWIIRRETVLHAPLSKLEIGGFGLVLGGAIGNMLDRWIYGQVTDFLYFVFWPSFPVFNLADALIDVGVGLIVLSQLLPPSTTQAAQKDE
jgi:signal peptidase II